MAEPYGFEISIEREIATLASGRQHFFSRIGNAVDPECLLDPDARLALEAAQAIGAERGTGPSSTTITVQRLNRWMQDGRVKREQIDSVIDMFDEVDDRGAPDEEDLIAEIVPILKRRINDAAVQESINRFGKNLDLRPVADQILEAERLGGTAMTIGTSLDHAFDEIDKIRDLTRLRTGVVELDHALEGGFEQGSLFVFAGRTGDGKSIMLVQCAVEALLQGYNVAFATLEVSKPRTLARVLSNMTAVPVRGVLNGSRGLVQQRLADIRGLGTLVTEYFVPDVTTVGDIRTWTERAERKLKIKFDFIVIDYADLLTPEVREAGKQANSYVDMKRVYEGFRMWMEETLRWGATASQAKLKSQGSKKQRHLLDNDDLADSSNKARKTDGLITLNVAPDGKTITFYIAKNRNGESRITVGPLPTQWDIARIAPVDRPMDPGFVVPDDLRRQERLRGI
jgi:RecA/RadA recombinase